MYDILASIHNDVIEGYTENLAIDPDQPDHPPPAMNSLQTDPLQYITADISPFIALFTQHNTPIQ